VCKRKKKEWINNRVRGIEEAKTETRKFYIEINKHNIEQLPTALICKDVNGKMSHRLRVLQRWKEYSSAPLYNEELLVCED
jgi:hypothetical protein